MDTTGIINFLIENPILCIGAFFLFVGCLEIGHRYSKWAEKTIKDELYSKISIIFGWVLISIIAFCFLNNYVA
jgi:multisubunit Na+/H+ antiporter MnhG subunit